MMKETTSERVTPRFKRSRTKLFNVCKAIDYGMSWHDDGTFTVYDISGNAIGRATADQWLAALKEGIRHKFSL